MELDLIIEKAGGVTVVAKAIGRHHSTIIGWRRHGVPAEHARQLAKLAGITAHDVRPDLYDSSHDDEQPQDAA